MQELERFVQQVLAGHKRSVARAVSLVENEDALKFPLLEALYPHSKKAYVLGFTGSPGAGKSTMVDQMISHLRSLSLKVGVLAVDPTSPYSGGALLGDRVRMVRHSTDPGVYIRSMGTRGHLGGLSRASRDVCRILAASGCDVILVETVGVGQSELDVRDIADTVIVVLHPAAGDVVQAFKAGIMEIADLFVVNKADLPGADKVVSEVQEMLDVSKKDAPWRPPVHKASISEGFGIDALWELVIQHRDYLQSSGLWATRRQEREAGEVMELARDLLVRDLTRRLQAMAGNMPILQEVREGRRDPYSVAREVAGHLLKQVEG